MRTSVLTAGIAGVLAVGGATAAFAATNGNDDTPTNAQTATVQRATTSAIISHARANLIAHQTVPGARIMSGELEHRDTIWDIDLIRGQVRYEVDIDAQSGRVLEVDRDFDDDRDDDRRGGRADATTLTHSPTEDVRRLDSPRDVQERGSVRHPAPMHSTAPRHSTAPEDNPARQHEDNHRNGVEDNHGGRHGGDDRDSDKHGTDNSGRHGDDHGGDDHSGGDHSGGDHSGGDDRGGNSGRH